MTSLIEVARLAGVSRQTVSNVINAPERVAASTRERVEAAIAELGYQPQPQRAEPPQPTSAPPRLDLSPRWVPTRSVRSSTASSTP
jgi:hypothetical protein